MVTAELKGKAVLVTGASSGIGLATVELFGRCGAKVALNHLPDDPRGPEQVERLCGTGMDVVGAPGDVSQPGVAQRMVEQAVADLGRLDVLINNAGTSNTVDPVPFEDLDAMTEEFWNIILSTNLVGPFRCSHAAAPHLAKTHGSIVNTASVAGLGTRGSSIAYGASKAGLINLTRNLGIALGPLGTGQRGGARARRHPMDAAVAGGAETPIHQCDHARTHREARGHCERDAVPRRAPRDQRADAGRGLRAHIEPAVSETGPRSVLSDE